MPFGFAQGICTDMSTPSKDRPSGRWGLNIGIRHKPHELFTRALTVKPNLILVQYLGEVVLLTLTGWSIGFSLSLLALPLGISLLTGLCFGIYPARKAAANPIQGLWQFSLIP